MPADIIPSGLQNKLDPGQKSYYTRGIGSSAFQTIRHEFRVFKMLGKGTGSAFLERLDFNSGGYIKSACTL
jgi:hypothetical protein